MNLVKSLRMYRGLSRDIYVLFYARIINCMGGFVFPFLTIYMTRELKIGEDAVGLYVTLFLIAAIPGALLGGKIADRYGRKNVMVVFQIIGGIFVISCTFTDRSLLVPWLLIISEFFDSASFTANTALVADKTNKDNRNVSYGLLYLGVNIGFAVGPSIAGFLYNNYIKWIFIGDALTRFLSVSILMLFIKEPKMNSATAEGIDKHGGKESNTIIELIKRPQLLTFTLVSMIFSFVFSGKSFLLPLQINSAFGEAGPEIFGGLMTFSGILVLAATTFIIYKTKKVSALLNTAASGLLYGTGFLVVALFPSLPAVIVSVIFWSLGEILKSTYSSVYLANNIPQSHRGRLSAVISQLSGAGYMLGPLVMGYLVKLRGVEGVWMIIFILSLLSAALMIVLYYKEKENEKLSMAVE